MPVLVQAQADHLQVQHQVRLVPARRSVRQLLNHQAVVLPVAYLHLLVNQHLKVRQVLNHQAQV